MKRIIFLFMSLLSFTFQAFSQDTASVKKLTILEFGILGNARYLPNYSPTELSAADIVSYGYLPSGDSAWIKYSGQTFAKSFMNEGQYFGFKIRTAVPIVNLADTVAVTTLFQSNTFNLEGNFKLISSGCNLAKDTFFMEHRFYMQNLEINRFNTVFDKSLKFKLTFTDVNSYSKVFWFYFVTRSPKHLLNGSIVGNDLLPDSLGFTDETLQTDSTTLWHLNKEDKRELGMNSRLKKFDLKKYIKDSIGSNLEFDLFYLTKDSSEFYMTKSGVIDAVFDTDSLKTHYLDLKVKVSSPYISRVFDWPLAYSWADWKKLNGGAVNADTFTVNGDFRVYTSTIVPYESPEDAITIDFQDSTLNPVKIRSLNRTDFNPMIEFPEPGDSVFAIAKAVYSCTPQEVVLTDTIVGDTIVVYQAQSFMKSAPLQKSPTLKVASSSRNLVFDSQVLNINVTKKSGENVTPIRPTVYRAIIKDTIVVNPVKYVTTDIPPIETNVEDFKPIINYFGIKITGYKGPYSLVDLNGRVVLVGVLQDDSSINISSLSSGIYLLRIVENGYPKVIKFSK
ncbi:TPA: hypothetical protein DEP21_04185 [Patescibacteria group bacterium]|nr:hypothetical protein [Candidatus Gracilibacteria bacterium]